MDATDDTRGRWARRTAAIAVAALLAPVLGEAVWAQIRPPDQQQGVQVQQDQARQDQGQLPLQPSTLLPLNAREKMMVIVEGEARGERVTMSLQRAGTQQTQQALQTQAEWVLTLEGYNRVYLTQNQRGAIVIERIDLLDRNEAIVYDPPVTLLPATVRGDRTFRETSRAVVYNLETGEQTNEGRATHQLQAVSRRTFYTPAGRVEGYLVDLGHTVDLDLATLDLNLEIGYEPQQGVVHRRMKYNLQKIGLFGESDARTVEVAGGAVRTGS